MKKQTNFISRNLAILRQYHKFSQEEIAEKIGVSRQAVAKWESGETIPDILNCDALAKLFDVSVDDLIHYDPSVEKTGIPPKGKHLFGTVKVGDRGQIVLPKKARDIFQIHPGDLLVVLGDEIRPPWYCADVQRKLFWKPSTFYRALFKPKRKNRRKRRIRNERIACSSQFKKILSGF